MRLARLAGGILVVLMHVAPPASASARVEKPLTLGGSVTVTGRTSYSRLVQIDKPVSMKLGDWQVIAQRGRFAGFVLRQEGGEELMPTVVDVWPGMCTSRACERAKWAVGAMCLCYFETDGPQDFTATLRPGRYRLYLIADGAPVTVRIPLPGLRGKTTISRGSAVSPVIDTPKPAQLEPPISGNGVGGNAYSAGSSHVVGRNGGMHISLSWKYLVGAPRGANAGGICFYDKPPTSSDGVPYQTPCSGGRWARVVTGQDAIDAKGGPQGAFDLYATSVTAFGILESGPVSIGGHINSPGPATGAFTQNFWLDFAR